MANWFYYDNNGQKQGPISTSQLKSLAAQGVILPETIVETESGQRGKARKINGLTFSENLQAEPLKSAVNPFSTIPVPPAVAVPVPANAMEMLNSEWSFDWLEFSSIGRKLLRWFVVWLAKLVHLICLVTVILTLIGVTVINVYELINLVNNSKHMHASASP